jgi:hypothetical protein
MKLTTVSKGCKDGFIFNTKVNFNKKNLHKDHIDCIDCKRIRVSTAIVS